MDAILRESALEPVVVRDDVGRRLRTAGYELVPTFEVPHYDVVLPAADADAAGSLLSWFGPAERNEYHRRR